MTSPLFSFFGSLALGSVTAIASEAAFSSDGKTVYAISSGENTLLSFKEGQQAATETPFPKQFFVNDFGPTHLLSDPKGLLVAAAGKLWLWNPGEPEAAPKLIATLPPQFDARGLTRGTGEGVEGTIFLTGYHSFGEGKAKPKEVEESNTFYALKAGQKSFKPVFVRRLEHVTAAPVFAGSRMFFGGDHDVWEGGMELDDGMEDRNGTLWGHRIAPLSMMNTDGANSGAMSVRSLVVAGNTLYAAIGGRHMGSIAAMPLPKDAASDEHPDLAASWKIQADMLAKTKVLNIPGTAEGEDDSDLKEAVDGLCVWSGEGSWKVAFRSDHQTFWLITKDAPAAPKKLGVQPAGEE